MKRTTISICIFLFCFSAKAQQENLLKVDARISEVTVYLNGAEIRQSKEIRLLKGRNKIIFQGLSAHLQSQSTQVSIKGDIEILSVSTETKYLSLEKIKPEIIQLRDSVSFLQDAITLLDDQIDAYNTEKMMLSKNQSIGGQGGVSVIELQKAADFHRERTLQINRSVSELEKKLRILHEKLTLSNSQLNELNYKNNPERKQVVIILNSAADLSTTASLRYLVTGTAWAPLYDIIAKDISKPVVLKYKAKVYNNTGLNWDAVKLKLSTADPSLSASRPYLTTWNLNYNSEENEGRVEKKSIGKFTDSMYVYDGKVNYTTVSVSELSFEFVIDKPYDIPSDAKPYTVDITEYSLDAVFQYLSIPKVDKDVFLLAKISGWGKLNLIDGPANVYFGDTYVGETDINTRFVEDTLDLSLGRDNQVLVTRIKREDNASKKIIGTNRTETFLYEITVKNNRTVPISLELQDQVPISQESDISVDAIETSGAVPDPQTGKLLWEVRLNPGEVVKYTVSFSVKYPKNRNVMIRKNRVIMCPDFF